MHLASLLRPPVSRRRGTADGKSLCLASHRRLQRKLTGPLAGLGIRFEANVRNLGIECRGGGKRSSGVRAARARALQKQVRLLAGLKRAGGQVSKVAKTGLKPATMYGVKCLGLPKQHVLSLRRATAACLAGRHGGKKSTTLRLAINKCEV